MKTDKGKRSRLFGIERFRWYDRDDVSGGILHPPRRCSGRVVVDGIGWRNGDCAAGGEVGRMVGAVEMLWLGRSKWRRSNDEQRVAFTRK